jgi:hypothetical protein
MEGGAWLEEVSQGPWPFLTFCFPAAMRSALLYCALSIMMLGLTIGSQQWGRPWTEASETRSQNESLPL